jgi:TIR domain
VNEELKNKDEYDVFICYSRKDRRWVTKFVEDLSAHFIKPWIDELEVKIGYPVRATIEKGIEQSRFFCLIISNSSMRSYYVRKVELEAAFTKMFERKKDSLILPVILRKPTRKLPLMLRQLHYLDFTNRTQYVHNLLEFVKRVRLGDIKFTGSLWYKGLDVSSFGMLLGVGEYSKFECFL